MYLIIQLARLGDLFQTARLVESVKQRGETHLCVDSTLVDVARLAFPGVTVHGLELASDRVGSNVCTFGTLAGLKFEAVYNLNHAGLNRAVARLFPPEIVLGYRAVNGQPERDAWLGLAMHWTRQRRHSPLNLVDMWGLLSPDPVPPQNVNPPAVPRPGPLGVALAGRNARRSLPPHLLAPAVQVLFEQQCALGGAFNARGRPEIRLLGGKSERGLGRELMGLLSPAALACTVNLAGRTSLPEIVACVRELGCLLTPDTGLMHMATRFGVPVQAVFLSSAWAWETGPYGLGHTVWQASPVCAPCLESAPCGADVRCARQFGRAWLRALAGSTAGSMAGDMGTHEPEAPTRLTSDFDPLGLVWRGGKDDPRREALRWVLAEACGCMNQNMSRNTTADPHVNAAAVDLYDEAQWMLPRFDALASNRVCLENPHD